MRIYVAGPYSPKSEYFHTIIQEASQNVHEAIEIGIRLIEKGHYPHIPHLTHFIHIHPECSEYGEWYYSFDESYLEEWAQAVYLMEGWEESKGARREKELADKLGLEVFRSMREVPSNNEEDQKKLDQWLEEPD